LTEPDGVGIGGCREPRSEQALAGLGARVADQVEQRAVSEDVEIRGVSVIGRDEALGGRARPGQRSPSRASPRS